MSAKKTQNDFSLLRITEMCPVPFCFSLLQQDPTDGRLKLKLAINLRATSFVLDLVLKLAVLSSSFDFIVAPS